MNVKQFPLSQNASEFAPESVNFSGVSLVLSKKITNAGLSYTVKDESHKVAKLPIKEAIKNSWRFKIAIAGAEEPFGVTVIELSDAQKQADIMSLLQTQWKMVEQISPGKYLNRFALETELQAIVFLVARVSDIQALESVLKTIES